MARLLTRIYDSLIAIILKPVLHNPGKSLGLLVNIIRRFARDKKSIGYFESMEEYLRWNADTIKRIYSGTDASILARLLRIYLTRMHSLGPRRRKIVEQSVGFRVPDVIIAEITARCNLSCEGCYSHQARKRQDGVTPDWNAVITEAKQCGIFNIFWSGGEPLVAQEEIFRLAAAHPDVWFSIFTNGTLIDAEIAKHARAMRNIVFLVSLNGLEEENDRYRGMGSYQRAMQGIRCLRNAKVPFGISVTVYKDSLQSAIADSYIQTIRDAGASFIMYFPYLPGNLDEMAYALSPQERKRLYEGVIAVRSRFKISAFFSHLNFMGACAGGGRLIYINAMGNVQPCPFTPFTSHNVKDGLIGALSSPMNAAYAEKERSHTDPLSMCFRLDHPLELAEILSLSGAHVVDGVDPTFFTYPPVSVVEASTAWRSVSSSLREGMDGKQLIKKLGQLMEEEANDAF